MNVEAQVDERPRAHADKSERRAKGDVEIRVYEAIEARLPEGADIEQGREEALEPDDEAPGRVQFMDCPFDLVTLSEAMMRVTSWCRGDRRPRTIITVNAAILVAMKRNLALAHACRAGDLIVPDGVPVVWASRLAGAPLRARVAGVDLMTHLLEVASAERRRVFFLGAKPEVLAELLAVCRERYPGLVVAGARDGYFGATEHDAVIEQIRDSGADFLFVGMPTPFKEVWCERYRHALGVPVIMGVGGSFDVLAGHIRRAPRLLQQAGLEWSWRLAMEPRKMWRRYLVTNTAFIARTFTEVTGARRREPPAGG